MPSIQLLFFTASLVVILYTLVPEGRWRNTGKWVAVGPVALNALGRVALGADAPTDILVGVALGVTVPLVAYRWFTPNEVYPIGYRRARGAHLDVGGARGQAIRRALADQLGLVVTDITPFGLSGSAGSTPLRITVEGDPPRQLFGKLYAQSHSAPTGGTSWAANSCTAGWRTRSRSTPCGGWSNKRTTPCR